MLVITPAFLAGLGLLLQGVQAAPPVASPGPELTSILEEIDAHTPITWVEVVNPDGSKSNITDIPNAVWDDAVANLAPHRTTGVVKRQSKSCYGSGSWAKQVVLQDGLPDACVSLKDTPFGQTRVYLRPGYNSAGDPMTVHYTKQRSVTMTDPLGGECLEAAYWLIDACHGNNQDSRGGSVNWRTGNRYSIDPQTHNCNC